MGRYENALARIDAANSGDPNRETFEGREYSRELLYSMRMTHWLDKLRPGADEILRLAARAQHIRRWEIPRSKYPMDRAGYLKWRTDLKDFHAKVAGEILSECGYDEGEAGRIGSLLRKERLKSDPDMQLLEDVICLVFLENYFQDFSRQHEEDKIIGILQKTWKKMSPRGQEAALELKLPPAAEKLVRKALGG